MPRHITQLLDNKKTFALLLAAQHKDHLSPPTFFSIDEAMKFQQNSIDFGTSYRDSSRLPSQSMSQTQSLSQNQTKSENMEQINNNNTVRENNQSLTPNSKKTNNKSISETSPINSQNKKNETQTETATPQPNTKIKDTTNSIKTNDKKINDLWFLKRNGASSGKAVYCYKSLEDMNVKYQTLENPEHYIIQRGVRNPWLIVKF